jgi:hypothetical protein
MNNRDIPVVLFCQKSWKNPNFTGKTHKKERSFSANKTENALAYCAKAWYITNN